MTNVADAPGISETARYAELLDVLKLVASHRDLGELFQDLAQHLHAVLDFSYLSVVLQDPVTGKMRMHVVESQHQGSAHIGMEFTIDETQSRWVLKNQEPLLVPDIAADLRFPSANPVLLEHGVRSLCSFPLTTPRRRLGAYSLGSSQPNAYAGSDFEFPLRVAEHVALAVENALNFEQATELQRQVMRERDRLKLLLDVNNAVVSKLSLSELIRAI